MKVHFLTLPSLLDNRIDFAVFGGALWYDVAIQFLGVVDVPKDLKLNLMSGSSISVSWNPVEGASSYTLSVVPTPTMENDYTVKTDFAFVDGLSIGTEYTIRVRAHADGMDSAFSTPLKVTPSGAPIIAPAPRVVSYDETSVSLSRPHLHHYRNGNDFTRIYVLVTDSTGARQELEFPVSAFLLSHFVLAAGAHQRSSPRRALQLQLAFRQHEGDPTDLFASVIASSTGDMYIIDPLMSSPPSAAGRPPYASQPLVASAAVEPRPRGEAASQVHGSRDGGKRGDF